ncbi:helix-turn-helix transcriptional regulator [Ignavibacterium sp.]|jgi:transcriptional regulator with XRE-family HTH domain|uniref:helix-turn-helix domain-containing protein n=1 Tax=Ignavibacterium sp. TaxID=2651167 RepID=UPI0025C5CA37|nr:helix-turn-helix transcriptional regulator [Ignavibacterium sp.]
MLEDDIISATFYSIGAMLKRIRIMKGYSLQNISEKTGILPSELEDFEEGDDFNISVVKFLKWARALDCMFIFEDMGSSNKDFDIILN